MRVGLLFGSFNPIHTGHLIIANSFINYGLNEVWFVVSPRNPFKEPKELLNAERRLQLVTLAVEKDERFKTCDIELYLPTPSYTVETLTQISRKYDHEFFLIMGSDNFSEIAKWKSSNKIIHDYTILVYERPNFPINEEDIKTANLIFTRSDLLDISSTKIRRLIEENKSIRYLVPDSVRAEIEAKRYYRK